MLHCENKMCYADINGQSRKCPYETYINANVTLSQPIQCCYCETILSHNVSNLYWECENVTTPSQTGEY